MTINDKTKIVGIDKGAGMTPIPVEMPTAEEMNLTDIAGTALTGADWTPLLQHLNVDLGTLLQTADQPLDVSAAEVDVDINSVTYGNLPVDLKADSLTGNLDVDIAAASGAPLDVSAAEVDVDINSLTYGDLPVATERERKTPVHKHVTSADATGGANVWDPTGGTKFVITDLKISVGGATTVTLDDGGTDIEVFHLAANGGVVSNQQTEIVSAAADNVLGVTTADAVDIAVTVDGYEV